MITTPKTPYIQRAADWARRHGFRNIQANAEGYPIPRGYGRQQDGQVFMPDVTGQQVDQRSYFEVVLKTMEVDYLVSKLKLLSQLAVLQGGELYLLAPKGHLSFAKSMATTSGVSATIVDLL